jgi:type II secretory pathway component GspD/PulD (secretin)
MTALMIGAAHADYPLTIIELKHRPPEDLVPLLEPLAGPDGVVTGANSSLFVRASPDRLADIRAALARLDSAARNLLIEVRRRSAADSSSSSFAVSVDEPIGSDGRVRVGPDRQTGVRARTGRRSDSRDLRQQVRVMDGGQAFINVGSEQPVGYRDVYTGPYGTRVESGIGYVNANNGFFVRPRVSGDRVDVEVSTHSANFQRGGAIDTGAVDTRVSGRLGEWIPLGASHLSAERQVRGLTDRRSAAGVETDDLELRVRAID